MNTIRRVILRKTKVVGALCIFFTFFLELPSTAQTIIKDSGNYVITVASDNYNKNRSYKKLWGEHYRKEWATAVAFKKINLDSLAGGLTVYDKGGGRQSKSLRLRDGNKQEYVLRSIDKSFGAALPEIVKGTFVEKLVNDQVTISHPYSALTIAPLAEAAGIYHADPVIYYLPRQPALKEYNDEYGDRLYLFEQRPDESWETAANFGNSKNIVGTDRMLEKILEDNDNQVDQRAYVRARLFDMLIGDWGRHEDQWRWASFKDDKKTIYKPIPRDRDNAYTRLDGLLLKVLVPAVGAKHMQNFDNKIKDVERLAFPARNLDHHLTNQVTRQEWISIANEIKTALTDEVIDNAIKRLPADIYQLSGPGIAAKLKSRRDMLPGYAEKYFLFLASEVEITGSEDTEFFEVKRLSDKETEINIYKITNEGKVKDKPFYHRVFNNDETKQVRIYGLRGRDEYKVTGKVNRSLQLRLIGGTDKDKFVDESSVKRGGNRTKIYDNYGNDIQKSGETKVHLSKDSSINAYKYDYFKYSNKSIRPILFYNREDRIHVGIGYTSKRQLWRRQPFGNYNHFDIKYSIEQGGFSTTYNGIFTDLIGKWNLAVDANYDMIRWTNFYGLGNESKLMTTERDYFRLRSRELLLSTSIEKNLHYRHRIKINPFYQWIDLISDTERFVAKLPSLAVDDTYKAKSFVGANFVYLYQNLDDSILPVKGVSFETEAGYTFNLTSKEHNYSHYLAALNLFVPFTKKIGVVLRAGGATLTGTPEFYQYNTIGGSRTLRGYQRDRFYGSSTFFNQNELRWISDVRSYLFNGKIGFFGLYDIGRVWLKGETSNSWHSSYGGGIIVSPFNKISIRAAYAKSPEDRNIHVHIIKVL